MWRFNRDLGFHSLTFGLWNTIGGVSLNGFLNNTKIDYYKTNIILSILSPYPFSSQLQNPHTQSF